MGGAAPYEEALQANRGGRLSDAQRGELEAGLRARHNGISGSLALRLDPRWMDARAGAVEQIEGAITKRTQAKSFGGGQPGTQYVIRIASRDRGDVRFNSIGELWKLLPEAGFVRLYYLPRSRWAVNFEPVQAPADAPAAEASHAGLERAAEAFTSARQRHDRVGQAEAFAAAHSIEQQAMPSSEGASGAGAGSAETASAAETGSAAETAPAAEPLAQAILGSWRSGLMRIGLELREDGTLVGELPDGSRHEGRWSLQGSHLSADLPGTPVEAEAAISGGQLILTMDGQSLAFERSG